MKKIFKALVALFCTACISMGVLSCAEVKGKSKIQRITITLDVNGTVQDFNFELYLNYAPGTIEHFTYLAKDKAYYNNTVVSNVAGHVEFGSYYMANGELKSKYDKDLSNGYFKAITSAYAADKYLGNEKSSAYLRYTSDLSIKGEFAANGYVGNDLGLNGALVLKRDVDTETSAAAYNTGKATMAVAFGNDYYFNSNSEFAIIGMICTDDATDSQASSYDRLKKLMSDYDADSKGNVYYYYTLGSEFGNYFMLNAEDNAYYAKGEDGEFSLKIEDDEDVEEDAHELLLDELKEHKECLNTIPYANTVITVKSITFNKK